MVVLLWEEDIFDRHRRLVGAYSSPDAAEADRERLAETSSEKTYHVENVAVHDSPQGVVTIYRGQYGTTGPEEELLTRIFGEPEGPQEAHFSEHSWLRSKLPKEYQSERRIKITDSADGQKRSAWGTSQQAVAAAVNEFKKRIEKTS